MYGMIGNIRAFAGRRDELVALLLENSGSMPGCLSYVVASDTADDDGIWVTEVWIDEKSHRASLEIPAVRETIGRAMPLIAGFGDRHVTTPVGGSGIGGE